jgi:hypothetical protein
VNSLSFHLVQKTPVTWLEQVFPEVCNLKVEPDDLAFAAHTVEGNDIREDLEYCGVLVLGIANSRMRDFFDIWRIFPLP